MKNYFDIFKEICAIPHGSFNLEPITNYFLDFAKEKHLFSFVDDYGNIIIKYKNENRKNDLPLILQSHFDMVCQKTPSSNHDFKNDPLKIVVSNQEVSAKNTTLGADNGLGVAMILALLNEKDLNLPNLEILLTADEEVGMLGAQSLDFSLLKGNTLINLDSDTEGELITACAGAIDLELTLKIPRNEVKGHLVSITLGGLKGGHSGIDINKNLGNSNYIMMDLVNQLYIEGFNFSIIDIEGGNQSNVIPRNGKISLLCHEGKIQFMSFINSYFQEIENKLKPREFLIRTVNEEENYVGSGILKDQILTLLKIYAGIPKNIIEGTEDNVISSCNIGIIKSYEGSLKISFLLRSLKNETLKKYEKFFYSFTDKFSNLNIYSPSAYPSWEFKKNSKIRDLCIAEFNNLYGKAPKIKAIHAGLECAIFSNSIKDLDIISFGPSLNFIHSPMESFSLDSSDRVYTLLKNIVSAWQ